MAAAASAEEQQRQQQQPTTTKDEAVMEISLATSSKCTQTKLEAKLEKETPSNEEVKAKSEEAVASAAAAATEEVSENATIAAAQIPVDNDDKGGEVGGSKMSVDQLGEGMSEENQGPVQGPRPQGEVCPWEDE